MNLGTRPRQGSAETLLDSRAFGCVQDYTCPELAHEREFDARAIVDSFGDSAYRVGALCLIVLQGRIHALPCKVLGPLVEDVENALRHSGETNLRVRGMERILTR